MCAAEQMISMPRIIFVEEESGLFAVSNLEGAPQGG